MNPDQMENPDESREDALRDMIIDRLPHLKADIYEDALWNLVADLNDVFKREYQYGYKMGEGEAKMDPSTGLPALPA